MGAFSHSISFKDGCLERLLELMEGLGRQWRRTRSDETNLRDSVGWGIAKQDLMNGRYSSVPIGFVSDEIIPELRSGKSKGYDHRPFSKKGSEKPSKQAMYME